MIGVLDLQGGVAEHLDHLRRAGINGVRVKSPGEFYGLAGLIIPGGESTCIARLLRIFELQTDLIASHQKGMKIWGTCAGAILLARSIIDESPHLALIDIEVKRNGFGSQLDSFAYEAHIPAVAARPVPLVFIRAPKIMSAGKGIEVLLRLDDYIAAAESEGVLVTVFHPELTDCLEFHKYFARKCGLEPE